LGLGNGNAGEEEVAQLYLVLRAFILVALRFIRGGAHGEVAGGDVEHFEANFTVLLKLFLVTVVFRLLIDAGVTFQSSGIEVKRNQSDRLLFGWLHGC
jgi:hypothetical protein